MWTDRKKEWCRRYNQRPEVRAKDRAYREKVKERRRAEQQQGVEEIFNYYVTNWRAGKTPDARAFYG